MPVVTGAELAKGKTTFYGRGILLFCTIGKRSAEILVEIDGGLAESLVPNTATRRTIGTTLSIVNHTIRIILRNEDYTCLVGGFYIAN